MDRRKLLSELEPVRRHFSSTDLNENTVLAAHLRSHNLKTHGETWRLAKEALQHGATFAEAALLMANRNKRRTTSAPTLPAVQIEQGVAPAPFEGTSLEWFPKPYGPGDLDGVGAKKLLGRPSVEHASVLLRETAQNSWDARGAARSIDYSVNFRLLDGKVIRTLRERIFTGDVEITGFAETFSTTSLSVIEIADRGTVGLGGPIRNDLEVPSGMETNFIDLVFNVGAPRDQDLSGGTYGFGKTISYVVSEIGTILIWTRCQGRHGLEHRLIGAAISDSFDLRGRRYTGRHWWGNVVGDNERIEPVVGSLAEELGNEVFARGFEGDETGTSILIIRPGELEESQDHDSIAMARSAVTHLWPKMVEDVSRTRMTIRIEREGREVPFTRLRDDPVMAAYADCLRGVRAAQGGETIPAPNFTFPVKVEEIWSLNPKVLLGHLALTRFPLRGDSRAVRDATCLMRNDAELVVKYRPGPSLDVEGFGWVGVFKPVEAVDDSFAAAEPPAHDDWIPQSVEDRARRSHVNVALNRIKQTADEYVRPPAVSSGEQQDVPSAAIAGDALASLLVGTTEGPVPSPQVRRSRGTRAARARVDIVASGVEMSEHPDWSVTWVDVEISGGVQTAEVRANAKVALDGGNAVDDGAIQVIGWTGPSGATTSGPTVCLNEGETARFLVRALSWLAVDIDIQVGGG